MRKSAEKLVPDGRSNTSLRYSCDLGHFPLVKLWGEMISVLSLYHLHVVHIGGHRSGRGRRTGTLNKGGVEGAGRTVKLEKYGTLKLH